MDQGGTQGSDNEKYSVFPDMEESRVCRDCSVPNSVTAKECGLHIRIVSTGIASQITLIGSRIVMGY